MLLPKTDDVHNRHLSIKNKSFFTNSDYRKIYNIRRTKPQQLNDSRLVLQLSLPNP